MRPTIFAARFQDGFVTDGGLHEVTTILYGTPCPVPYWWFGQHPEAGHISQMVRLYVGNVDLETDHL